MDKLEYWFLDSAVEMRIGFSWVVPDSQYRLAINRAPLPLTVPEMGRVLEGLFQKGDLLAITPSDENNLSFHQAFVPSSAQILAALEEKSNLSYFLTPQGGKRWESVSKPDWKQYGRGTEPLEPPDVCELICQDRQLIERYLQLHHLIYGTTYYEKKLCACVIPGTEIWDKLTPWKPTYWKTLPFAYRVSYQIELVSLNEEQKQELIPQEREAGQWLRSLKRKWQIDYFKLSTTLNLVEYLILKGAIKEHARLQNVVFEGRLSQAEVIRAAYSLFEKGDILAQYSTEKILVKDVSLNKSQIQAHLDGKLDAWYYVTPQGGAKWEAVTHANWNRYYQWRDLPHDNSQTPELTTSEIISPDRRLIDYFLQNANHSEGEIVVPGTEIASELEPWQATYWKTLPFAYKLRYQYRNSKRIDSHSSQEWIEPEQKAIRGIEKVHQWYTKPEFEETEPQFPTYYPTPKENNLEKIEYLILRKAIIYDCLELRVNDYSIDRDYEELSHGEIAIGADSLFQKGYIKARVFADGWADVWFRQEYIRSKIFGEVEWDYEGTPDVVLTMAGIQDHLDGILKAQYYLTPEGGARWEAMAHPDWNKFLINNSLEIIYEEEIEMSEEDRDKLLSNEDYLKDRKLISETEVWEVLKPWQITYWKTLPKGYGFHYPHDKSEAKLCEEFQKWYQDPSFS